MKHLLILLFLVPIIATAQDSAPKKCNKIEVSGVSFREIVDSLLQNDFVFDKIDSNYSTVKTEFKVGKGKIKGMDLALSIRVKDSVATISGEWYNSLLLGQNFLGKQYTVENSKSPIKNTSGNEKKCFAEMEKFAKSFGKPVNYLVSN